MKYHPDWQRREVPPYTRTHAEARAEYKKVRALLDAPVWCPATAGANGKLQIKVVFLEDELIMAFATENPHWDGCTARERRTVRVVRARQAEIDQIKTAHEVAMSFPEGRMSVFAAMREAAKSVREGFHTGGFVSAPEGPSGLEAGEIPVRVSGARVVEVTVDSAGFEHGARRTVWWLHGASQERIDEEGCGAVYAAHVYGP